MSAAVAKKPARSRKTPTAAATAPAPTPGVTIPLNIPAGVQTRPYQGRIVSKALDLFGTNKVRSILIESPTGSGKTVMGLLIAAHLQQALGLKVGWVAMRRYLLEQAEAENVSRGIGLKAEYISMFDTHPPEGLDLFVVDEAQHDSATSMVALHQTIRPKYILGLSATPFRADKVKLCFDTVIKDAGIQALITEGYLSPYRHYTLPRFDVDTVCRFYLADRERWGRSLMSFHSLAECEKAAEKLRDGGVRVEVVSGASDREQQLEDFKAGRLDVLVNCLLLSEGFNCPELKTVFCRPSCKSVTVQLAGRVLRTHPDQPVKNIVQCPKAKWQFARTAKPAMQYVWTEGEWRSLELNTKIAAVGARTIQALAKSNATLPDFVTKRNGWLRKKAVAQGKGGLDGE